MFNIYARHGLGTCPKCGFATQRIRRRMVDRLISRFNPVERYRCMSPACEWEGNLLRDEPETIGETAGQ